ncbi:MAG: hypothetical protein IPO21_07025 [Bacteroidales bacterium]|nr:hypothetical protein [Bacteroidales bacterium]
MDLKYISHLKLNEDFENYISSNLKNIEDAKKIYAQDYSNYCRYFMNDTVGILNLLLKHICNIIEINNNELILLKEKFLEPSNISLCSTRDLCSFNKEFFCILEIVIGYERAIEYLEKRKFYYRVLAKADYMIYEYTANNFQMYEDIEDIDFENNDSRNQEMYLERKRKFYREEIFKK